MPERLEILMKLLGLSFEDIAQNGQRIEASLKDGNVKVNVECNPINLSVFTGAIIESGLKAFQEIPNEKARESLTKAYFASLCELLERHLKKFAIEKIINERRMTQ